MVTPFCSTDTYVTAKQKFNNLWPNLTLELHHASAKFWHEGWDELNEDAKMIVNTHTAVPVFTLTEETLAGEAIRLFSVHFGGEALMLNEGVSVERNETLAYRNDSFILPLNKVIYCEYKCRFTEQLPNLSICLYEIKQQYMELKDNTVIEGRKGIRTAITDYTFISDWRHTLKRIGLAAAITNNRLRISWDGDMRPLQIKEFGAMEKKEDAYAMQP